MRNGSRWIAVLAHALLAACGGGGDVPAVPGEFAFVEGVGQSAPVATALPVDPGVQVRDTRGRPMAGATISFIAAGGTVSPASAVTGPDGVARTHLTLGTLARQASITAELPGFGIAVLLANALPGPPASIEKVQGDRQVAAPGAALPVEPRVRLRDAYGNLAAGATIACAVEAGGGTIADDGGVAGADGTTSCGAWTLGPGRGEENVLRVTAGVAPVQRFRAAAGVRTSANLTLTLRYLGAGSGPDRLLSFRADPVTVFQVAAISMAFAGLAPPMREVTLRLGETAWFADVLERDVARGTYLARAVAVDVNGDEADAFAWVDVDHLPVVIIETPALDGTLARPSIAFRATCVDDGPAGCVELRVGAVALSGGAAAIASGTAAVDGTADLSAFEGRQVELGFAGVDSAGQQAFASRSVFVESSPGLAVAAEAGGEVLDWDGARLLHRQGADGLAVTDASTGLATPIGASARPGPAFLTTGGAVIVDGPFSETFPTPLLEWTGAGAASEVADVATLRAAGDFALFRRRVGGALVRREVSTGTEVELTTAGAPAPGGVASNGDVVFVDGGEVVRFRGGVTTPITSGSPAGVNFGPISDGARVAWSKGGLLAVWDGAETLGNELRCPDVNTCFQLAGPWVAYHLPEDPAALFTPIHVGRQGPDGDAQVDAFASGARLEALLADGTVVLRTEQGPLARRRWRAAPGGPVVEVGSTLGRVVERGGKAYLLLGRSVLEVTP